MGQSSRTTGNAPIAAIDPGGTKPAGGAPRTATVEQKVQSGDRNTLNDGNGTERDAVRSSQKTGEKS